MTCPLCGGTQALPAPIYNLTVCPSCLRTLTATGQVATGAQTTALPPEAITALRRLRTSLRQAVS